MLEDISYNILIRCDYQSIKALAVANFPNVTQILSKKIFWKHIIEHQFEDVDDLQDDEDYEELFKMIPMDDVRLRGYVIKAKRNYKYDIVETALRRFAFDNGFICGLLNVKYSEDNKYLHKKPSGGYFTFLTKTLRDKEQLKDLKMFKIVLLNAKNDFATTKHSLLQGIIVSRVLATDDSEVFYHMLPKLNMNSELLSYVAYYGKINLFKELLKIMDTSDASKHLYMILDKYDDKIGIKTTTIIVNYLITTNTINLNFIYKSSVLDNAISGNKLDVVKLLTTIPDIDLSYNNNYLFNLALMKGGADICDYLHSIDSVKNTLDKSAKIRYLSRFTTFEDAYRADDMDMCDYLYSVDNVKNSLSYSMTVRYLAYRTFNGVRLG